MADDESSLSPARRRRLFNVSRRAPGASVEMEKAVFGERISSSR